MATKQKSGLYRARVKIGVDETGNDVYKYVSGKTQRDLKRAKEDAIRYYITGEAPYDDRLFGEYAQEWYRLRLQPKVSTSSAESYRTALNKHILPRFGDRKLRAIRPLELQTFIDSFAGASASQITYITATLKRIYKAACADMIVTQDPTAHLTKPEATPAEEKEALTPEQRQRLIDACGTHKYGLFLSVLFYLGLRGGEARGLMWGDVDWERHEIHIQRDIDDKDGGKVGKLKTRSSDRRVPIPDILYRRLQVERGLPNTFILQGELSGKPLAKTVMQRMWAHLMADCGLAVPCKNTTYRGVDYRSEWKPLITPHALRHNYITMCWEAGVDVYTTSKIVGHARIETTLRIYTHLTDAAKQVAADKLNDVFNSARCTYVAQAPSAPLRIEKIKALKSQ